MTVFLSKYGDCQRSLLNSIQLLLIYSFIAVISSLGLPAFFQTTNAKTALAGLTSLEDQEIPLDDGEDLDALIDEGNPENDDVTFGEGNVEFDKIPDFFAERKESNPASRFDQRIAAEFQSSVNVSASKPPPPGLTPAKQQAPQHYSGSAIFSSPNAASLPQPFQSPASAPMPPNVTVPQLMTPVHSSNNNHAVVGGGGGGVAASPFPGTPAAQPISALGTPVNKNSFKPTEYLGRGKFMSPSDVRYVVGRALQPLESHDPFADDFYNIQLKLKKNAAQKETALKQGLNPPAAVSVPLPTWRETKERIKLTMTLARRGFEERVKDWETTEGVLGHRIRTEVTKPRALLTLPSPEDLLRDFNDEEDEVTGETILFDKAPFASRLWATRRAVQQGYEALFTVQELQLLATSPSVAAYPQAVEEIRREIDSALTLLSQSLGIRPQNTLGNLGTPTNSVQQSQDNFSLDGRHVSALLQTLIGRKLLIRGLKLLSHTHRWALIPIILARVLLPASSTANTPSVADEAIQVERKLLLTIGDYLQHCYRQHQQLLLQTAPGTQHPYSRELLSNLRQCLKNVMITQMDRRDMLREALLAEKVRAEILYLIVQVGDGMAQGGVEQVGMVEWVQTREAFMSLLDS